MLEREKHVRPHQEVQLVLGEALVGRLHRLPGVALSFPIQLPVRSLHHSGQSQSFGSQAHHLQSVQMARLILRQRLVGRRPCRDQIELVQLQILRGKFGRCHMTQMDGIKGPAIDADLHRISSFPRLNQSSCQISLHL